MSAPPLDRSTKPARWLLILLVLFALASLSFDRSPSASAARTAPLAWQSCGGGFECATLSVPLDYAAPTGRQIDLALIRLRAQNPATRIGSLVFNPGGPGGSGLEFLRSWASSLPAELKTRFDLVSFDPRGVGASSPLECHDDVQKVAALNPSPQTPADWKPVEAELKAFADLCATRGGDVLPFLTTANVARDLDQIRAALGDDRLTYMGFSYGTMIGAVYADLFPDHVRAAVLDGAIDYSLGGDEVMFEQAQAYEGGYAAFLENCRANRCLSATSEDPGAAIDGLLAKAATAPIPSASADRPAGPGEIVLAIIQSLVTPRLWPDLGRALNSGLRGDGSGLVKLADDYYARQPNGTYDNLLETYNAFVCQDYGLPRDPAHYESIAPQFAAAAPHFGLWNLQTEVPCAYWSAPPPPPLKAPRAPGAPPILVVGTTNDPITPYKWAVSLSKELESGVLLTYDGQGHTAYLDFNQCVTAAVDAYLISLQAPAPGTTCGAASLAEPLKIDQVLVSTPTPPPSTVVPPPIPTPSPSAQSTPTSTGKGGGLSIYLVAAIIAVVAVLVVAVVLWRRGSARRA